MPPDRTTGDEDPATDAVPRPTPARRFTPAQVFPVSEAPASRRTHLTVAAGVGLMVVGAVAVASTLLDGPAPASLPTRALPSRAQAAPAPAPSVSTPSVSTPSVSTPSVSTAAVSTAAVSRQAADRGPAGARTGAAWSVSLPSPGQAASTPWTPAPDPNSPDPDGNGVDSRGCPYPNPFPDIVSDEDYDAAKADPDPRVLRCSVDRRQNP